MAENNKDVESFALGLIIAAIVFLLFRRELERFFRSGCDCESGAGAGSGSGAGASGTAGCKKCADGCTDNVGLHLPENPGVSPGASLSGWSFSPGSPRGGSPVVLLGVGNSYEANLGYNPAPVN